MHVSVRESGTADGRLYQGEFQLGGFSDVDEMVQELVTRIETEIRPGKMSGVQARMSCSGVVLDPSGETSVEALFRLSSSAYGMLTEALDRTVYNTVALETCSDAWMPYDLMGRPQPRVHALNAPRLEAALLDLSEALDADTEPDDPTSFAQPTETGLNNHFNPDGSAWNVWESFEMPRRTEAFRHGPAFDSVGYKRSRADQVQYVPVIDGLGRTLGYLWASDADGAASFEPRDDAGEEGIKAGMVWLDRLHKAYERGLSPTQAIDECARLSADEPAGSVPQGTTPQYTALVDLRERASHGAP
ncbi:hypothetical protein [Streptomyces sp. MN13]